MSFLLDSLLREVTVLSVVVAALDILVVYYLIYRILLVIKGTRAQQMVVGIFLIGAGFFLAERLKMATLSWILSSVKNYFVIIVIILFQQDIRRGLTLIGKNVVRSGKTPEVLHALDEITRAALHLAKARMGGLFVFERDAVLQQFSDHGKAVDASVTKELLVSLFVPSRDNALHDGAVIIDANFRVASAGVVLPLSRSVHLSQDLGTRHRAALGITEETDAVALVVSEERGEISLCLRGSIAQDLDEETLRSAMRDIFYPESGTAAETMAGAEAAAGIAKAVAALANDSEKSRPIPLDVTDSQSVVNKAIQKSNASKPIQRKPGL